MLYNRHKVWMRGILVSQKIVVLKVNSDGIIYRRLAKYQGHWEFPF